MTALTGFENMPDILRDKYRVYTNNDFMMKVAHARLRDDSIDILDIPKFNRGKWENMIKTEISYNPYYFFRKILRNIDGEPFDVNVGTLTLIRLMICNANIICALPRQSYVNTTCAGMMLWECLSNYGSRVTSVYSKGVRDCNREIDRVYKMYEQLPDFLKSDVRIKSHTQKRLIFDNDKTILSCGDIKKDKEYVFPGSEFFNDAEYTNLDPKNIKFRDIFSWRVFHIHGINEKRKNAKAWHDICKESFLWDNQLHLLDDTTISRIARQPILLIVDYDEIHDETYYDNMKKMLDEDSFNREVLLNNLV
jgi:hypothetical protein